ncbi:MAG TPA: hypothetical protein VFU93_14945 [Acidimicrobiales bacterium]|nr:hypothetical protein [Acidimicrobiales bacterium]
MRMMSKVAGTAVLLFTLFPAVAANAQVDCARADYCNPNTPDVGGSDSGSDVDTDQPRGDSAGGPGGAPVSGGAAGSGGTTDDGTAGNGGTTGGGTAVLGAESEAPTGAVSAESGGAAAATAPSGALPITGGDVIGIAAFGAAAVGLGTILVKRSKAARLA